MQQDIRQCIFRALSVFGYYNIVSMLYLTDAYLQFKGSSSEDVEQFLYMYFNVLIIDRNVKGKAASVFTYLSFHVKVKQEAIFVSGCFSNENSREFNKVCTQIFKEYAREVELDAVIIMDCQLY